jgi:hypothetical protein
LQYIPTIPIGIITPIGLIIKIKKYDRASH